MGIALDAKVGQMDDFRHPAVSVDAGHKFFCHHEFAAPLIGANFISRAIRNVVTIKRTMGSFVRARKDSRGTPMAWALTGS